LRAYVEERGLVQVSDPAVIGEWIDDVLGANPEQLAQFRGGKTKLQGFFVG
jgi:aspartyl-tRNA(Asn)/glutamyl-tRNA(Gln) amidotransferase subunit B